MKKHNPAGIAAASTYTHGIEMPAKARWLYISGQIGTAADGTPAQGIEAQVDRAWQNLKSVLASAGMSVDDLVKVTAFLTREGDVEAYRKTRLKHMGAARPASTLLIVKGLADPRWLVEVEAIAAK